MKKLMTCLFMCVILLGLTACTENKNPDTQANKEETNKESALVYKELTDPRGTTLESTATGKSNPKLVETLYETDQVIVADYIPTEMGYAVDLTGATDSTAGIQAALWDCYHSGGGTVYLPVGNYAISDTIYIPPYVTLQGDWQDPDEGNEYGTIISVWMEAEDYEGAGAFEVSGCAGAVGLTVYYPLQTMDCILPYPYSFYIEENETYWMLSTIKDITIMNGYRGIGTSLAVKHEQLQLENIKGTFLNVGIDIANSSDVGTVKNVVISNKYWKEASADCMNAVTSDVIDAYTREYVTGMRIGDLEWTTFNDISIDNCAKGIHLQKGGRIDFAGSLYDLMITNCEQGLVADGLDSRWGAVISRSHIEGGITNNTEGKIKLCDVEVVGDITEYEEGNVIVDSESDLSKYEMDYDATYAKPASNFYVAELPSGVGTDASKQLQELLDNVAETGGIVYVTGGLYCFKSPITVPAGVELRGTSSIPVRGTYEEGKGTIFYCYYGDDSSNTMEEQAFITLAGENAGVSGIRVFYPENSTKSADIHSTYAIRGTASGVYATNCMIVASAYGIDFRNCDNHYIEGIMTTCYYNAFRVGGVGGTMSKCLQNATVMERNKEEGLVDWIGEGVDISEWLFGFVLRTDCDYIVVEGATDQVIYNVFSYGTKTSITNINSENTRLVNIGNDNLGDEGSQFIQNGGSMTVINALRYNGYSYDFLDGKMNLYNRIAINEVGERTLEKGE